MSSLKAANSNTAFYSNMSLKQFCLSIVILFSALTQTVYADMVPEIWCERPWCNPALFAGFDVKVSRLSGREYWKQNFPKEYVSPNFYVGTQFHQYFQLLIGYEQSLPARVHVVYTPNDNFFGNDVGSLRFTRTMILEYIYASMEFICPLSFCQDLEGVVSVGGSIFRPRAKTTNIQNSTTELTGAMTSVTFNHPGTARGALGFQYRLNPVIFLRALIAFDNASRAHVGGDNPRIFLTNDIPLRPFSDMFSGYFGFQFKWGI